MKKLMRKPNDTMISLIVFSIFTSLSGCSNDLEAENKQLQAAVNNLKEESRQLEKEIRKQRRDNLEAQIALTDINTESQALAAQLGEQGVDVTQSEIALLDGDAEFSAFELAEDVNYVNLHYWRADKDYSNWGVHVEGPAAFERTRWSDPVRFRELTDYGAQARIRLQEGSEGQTLKILVHGEDGGFDIVHSHPKQPNGAPQLTEVNISTHQDLYLVSGIPKVFSSKKEALAAVDQSKENANR